MSKFKVGQHVVCIDAKGSYLDLYKDYYIVNPDCYSEYEMREVRIAGHFHSWMESRFEDFDEWASHQVAVSPEVSLCIITAQAQALQHHNNRLVAVLKEISEDTQSYPHAWQLAENVLKELGYE